MSTSIAKLCTMNRDTWLIRISIAWLALLAAAIAYLFVTNFWY
jgi:hypothetical protein